MRETGLQILTPVQKGTEAENSLQPVVKAMVSHFAPLQPMQSHGEAQIHLQPTKVPIPEQVDVPEGGCDPIGSLC